MDPLQRPLYIPFDQDDHLPPPPWKPGSAALTAWENAHGHDVRLKCYVEYGCQVIEEYEYWRGYTDATLAAHAAGYLLDPGKVAVDREALERCLRIVWAAHEDGLADILRAALQGQQP